jgi:hypothetical protein
MRGKYSLVDIWTLVGFARQPFLFVGKLLSWIMRGKRLLIDRYIKRQINAYENGHLVTGGLSVFSGMLLSW